LTACDYETTRLIVVVYLYFLSDPNSIAYDVYHVLMFLCTSWHSILGLIGYIAYILFLFFLIVFFTFLVGVIFCFFLVLYDWFHCLINDVTCVRNYQACSLPLMKVTQA